MAAVRTAWQQMSRRPRLAAVIGMVTAAGLVAALVVSAIGSGGPAGHPSAVSSERHLATSPVTAVDSKLIDRQAPAGRLSALLPGRAGSASPSLIIPALGVRAPVLPEGIDQTPGDRGNLAVPSNAREVGWWDGGPAPGQGGVAVVAGHRAVGGAFWQLPQLQTGAAIQVTGTNGQTTTWKVTQVQQLLKAQLPESIWTEGGPPKLALVTCGGGFNYAIGHYNDNVIVWAAPT